MKLECWLKTSLGLTLTLFQIALREARRRNERYRQYAIPSLGKIAELMQDVDMFDAIFGITQPVIEQLISTENDAMDVDVDVDGAVDRLEREAL